MYLLLPLLGVFLSSHPTAIEANLSLGFKVTKILRQHNTGANCNVGNTTYAHGETFKLDCKTQCVCENGRHACSSLCPKEQLPAPEDTISCRSPRLVEVPGHCCKMWLCENPTADVYATCHNASTSPWTPCSNACGLGISTRLASTNTGCGQLSSLRLCENRKCYKDNNILDGETMEAGAKHQLIGESWTPNLFSTQQRHNGQMQHHHKMQQHKIRKGHECRSIERLGPARIRLGKCISRKLYRPKICGRCHHSNKCCLPSVSTTIQVEVLCPLNTDDPITYAKQQALQKQRPLWDTQSLEPIDQEFLQSHQIQIENKFISVEWILKCECSQNEKCNDNTTIGNETNDFENLKDIRNQKNNYKNKKKKHYHNNEHKIQSDTKFGKINMNFNENDVSNNQGNHYNDNNNYYDNKNNKIHYKNYNNKKKNEDIILKNLESSTQHYHSVEDNTDIANNELQPDIIPYPPYPKSHHTTYNNNHNFKSSYNNKNNMDKNKKQKQFPYKRT